jgi:hypothetical protein
VALHCRFGGFTATGEQQVTRPRAAASNIGQVLMPLWNKGLEANKDIWPILRPKEARDMQDRAVTMRTSAIDRRREQRHTAVLRLALLLVDGQAQLCRVTNLSPQGLQATVFRPITVGSRAVISVPDGITLAGKIVWVADRTIGVSLDHPLSEPSFLRMKKETAPKCARRRLPRIGTGSPAHLGAGGRRYPITLLDISTNGAMVSATKMLPSPGPVQLHVNGLPLVSAQIRWIFEDRAGLMFNAPVRPDILTMWLKDHAPAGGPEIFDKIPVSDATLEAVASMA